MLAINFYGSISILYLLLALAAMVGLTVGGFKVQRDVFHYDLTNEELDKMEDDERSTVLLP